MNDQQVILVYRTNVDSGAHRDRLLSIFSSVRDIVEWSIDLEDCDRVLRVVCDGEPTIDVSAAMRTAGYECEELE